jgi:hypothetical protein
MKHVNTKMILGIVIASAFLLGSIVTPVSALQSVIIEQSLNTEYAPGANNHTYIYASADDAFFQQSYGKLHVNQDIDLTAYLYDTTGWSAPSTSFPAPTNVPVNLQQFDTFSNGPFGNPGLLPIFYDFIGSDGSGAVINTTIERRVFSLAFGQHTPVAMDSQYTYFGTLSISGQEFVHLTVASLQDHISWYVRVYDPQGRTMYSYTGTDGDIAVLPFRPTIAGTYYIMLMAAPSTTQFAQFDFFPEAIAPQLISPGEVITDSLPTGEVIVSDGTHSIVHEEMAPTVRTYKVDTGADVSSLYYSFNYPRAFSGIVPSSTQNTAIMFSSDAFVYDVMGGARFTESFGSPTSDIFSIRNGVNYITVMGGDNVEYTLYHNGDVAENLPLNHEFLLENYYGNYMKYVYSLVLDRPSLIKANSTSTSDYEISIYGVNEDGYFITQAPTDASTIQAAAWVYLPAGEYVVLVTVDPNTISEMIEFTLGPITSGYNAGIVYLGGIKLPTIPNHYYNLSLTLNNVYNVSSSVGIGIYDQFFASRFSTSLSMGTWWDGSTAVPHSTHVTNVTYTIANQMWSDEYAMLTLIVNPYNNTAGVGPYYPDYPMNFTIDWVDVTYDDYNATATLDVAGGAGAHNFTLAFPGESAEFYALELNVTPGVWYNVSIKTADAISFQWIEEHAPYDHRTHYIGWSDLSDNLIGTVSNMSIQFGAISDVAYLTMRVNRALVGEGFLWIQLTPLPTNALALLPAPPAGGDLLALLGSIALPIGIGAVVIVVVAIVYIKKFKK